MANTYSFISKVVVGSGGASSISFTSIPQTYSDLKLIFSGKTNNNSWVSYFLDINGSALNISQQQLTGNGSAMSASINGSQTFLSNTWYSATDAGFSAVEIYIADYSSSNANKILQHTGGSEANQTTAYAALIGGRLNSSSPITSFTIGEVGATIQQNTTAYLYGISRTV